MSPRRGNFILGSRVSLNQSLTRNPVRPRITPEQQEYLTIMATKRTLTNIFFLSALAVGAGAALIPNEAAAGDKGSEEYKCSEAGSGKLDGATAKKLQKACSDAGVKTKKDMQKLMKDWKKKTSLKFDGKKAGCKDCHKDSKGYEGTKDVGYKKLSEYIK
jgi:hypothetical protein